MEMRKSACPTRHVGEMRSELNTVWVLARPHGCCDNIIAARTITTNLLCHCSCTPAQVVRTSSNAVTSAFAQVFSKGVSHGDRITTFIQLGSGAMVSVEQANDIVAKLQERETEQNVMKDLFNLDVMLNFRQAERHKQRMFNGKATEYTEYTFKMDAILSTMDPGGKESEVLRQMDDDEVTNVAAIYWNVLALNKQCVGIMLDRHDHRRSCRVLKAIAGSGLSVAGSEQMVPTKISC